MKIIKKISSIFIALSLMLTVFGFASAAPLEEEKVKAAVGAFQIGDPSVYGSTGGPRLREYPKVVDALSNLLLDVKVELDDLNCERTGSLGDKLLLTYVNRNILTSGSRYLNMLIFLSYASVLNNCKFISDYKYIYDQSSYGPMHFCYMPKIIDRNGNEQFDFIWVDKDECKKTVKQMMDGTFDINENIFWKGKFKNDDHDLLFLKHVQDAAIKYFGDIDSFFDDEEFSTIFFKTMFEIITDKGKSPGNDKKMISIVSSNSSAAISDYKRLGKNIIKKSLEYRGHEEGKDYEIEYDDSTGYIKTIKKLSNKDLKNGAVSVNDAVQIMSAMLIFAFIFLALIVIAAVVVIVVVLAKKR